MSLLSLFRRHSPGELWLLLEASIELLRVRRRLGRTPFREEAQRLGGEGDTPGERRLEKAMRVGRAVEEAARHLPGETLCLVRALAASRMLDRRRIHNRLVLGVARSGEDRLAAHAWVEVAGQVVVGESGRVGYSELVSFPPGEEL